MTPHICLVSLQGKPRLSRYRTPYASRCPASLFYTGNGRRKPRSNLLTPSCRLRHRRPTRRVESFQCERDIVAHIDQLRRKVKRNTREDDENAPEQKRKNNAESEFPTLRESVPIKPCMPEQSAEIPLPPPIASPKRSRPKPPPASPHDRSPVPTTPPIADNAQECSISTGSDEEPSRLSHPRRRHHRPIPQWSRRYRPLTPIQF